MPRKKKAAVAEAPTPESPVTAAPDIFDEQIEARKLEAAQSQPAGIVHPPADGTRTPDAEREAAHEHAHEHSHAARHQQHRDEGQSHADSVGKRPELVESGITYSAKDYLAGVRMGEGFRLLGAKKVRDVIIKFDEKPSQQIVDMMHEARFKWQPQGKLWTHPINGDSAWQDRAHGEATFDAVAKAVRQERGITHSVGVAS